MIFATPPSRSKRLRRRASQYYALSFFFVFRPRRAFAALLIFGGICFLLGALAARNDTDTALMAVSVGTVVMGPVLVNAVALVRHQMRLDRAPPIDPGSREV